jgi:uridine phosphorylase
VDYLKYEKNASVNTCWAGYHTTMYEFNLNERKIGIIGRAVGAPFAVLVAEQAFVSGCKYLISITSAGTIHPPKNNEKFLLIEQALRDEGTSFHYLPPDQNAEINSGLLTRLHPLQTEQDLSLATGKSWTTDAPYR